MSTPGFVYWVRSGDLVKIGFSDRPNRRIAVLQGAHGQPLELIALVRGTRGDEKALHAQFEKHRAVGEWFRLAPSVRRAADRIGVCESSGNTDTMVGVRLPVDLADRYHKLAREVDHRKLTDVMRLLLAGWSEEMEAKRRVVA